MGRIIGRGVSHAGASSAVGGYGEILRWDGLGWSQVPLDESVWMPFEAIWPTETDDDLEALARLAEDLVRAGRRVSGRRVEVKISGGCFVPKAWAPFQWQPFVPPDELDRRIRLLTDRFRRIRGTRLSWSEPDEAALEALLSRGGRELSATIERAHDLGAVFHGWSDHINLGAWQQAITDTGVDLAAELGGRETGAVLPWDIIDAGVRKNYLKAEWRRALREIATED